MTCTDCPHERCGACPCLCSPGEHDKPCSVLNSDEREPTYEEWQRATGIPDGPENCEALFRRLERPWL